MTKQIEPGELKVKARELLELLCTDSSFRYTQYQFNDEPFEVDEIQDLILRVYIIYLDSNKCFLPGAISELYEAMQKISIPTDINATSMIALAQNIQEICSEFLEKNAEWIRQRCIGILQDRKKGFLHID